MAKPYRVKRNGKYIGSWLARVKGQIVNLETKDAEEAKRRERRAQRGDFGWRKDTAVAVKEAVDGDADNAEEEFTTEEILEPVTEQATAAVSEGPSGPAAVAAAEGAAGSPVTHEAPLEAPVDPVAEVNAAADTAAGVADELKRTLGAAGIDLAGLMDPEFLGGLHVAGQDALFQFIAPMVTERKPQPFALPEKFAGAVKILGQAWQQQLQRWNISLDGVSPGALILLATGGMLVAQILALYKPQPSESAPQPAGVV